MRPGLTASFILPLLLAACGGSDLPGEARRPATAPAARAAAAGSQIESGMPPLAGLGDSHAMGLWKPNPLYDSCTQAQHDSFYVVAPDGLRYPTWHPPVMTYKDAATQEIKSCSFGHEHGADPTGSALWGWIQQHFGDDANGDGQLDAQELEHAGLPFGFVNQTLDVYNAARGIVNGMRHEDHVGHKVAFENDVSLQRNRCAVSGPGCYERINIGVSCAFLMKPHQGTHSHDAFANNMHELIYAVKCRDAGAMPDARAFVNTQILVAKMTLFGKAGGFQPAGGFNGGFIDAGQCTPANSPSGNGTRLIPVMSVLNGAVLVKRTSDSNPFSSFSALYEDWLGSNYITASDGRQLAYFDPHFAVFRPSRFFWPAGGDSYGIVRKPQDLVDQLGHSSDLCYMTTVDGRRARGGPCDQQTNYGSDMTPVPWDSPRSQFNGTHREMYFNQTQIVNPGGPAYWYSDPFGSNAVDASLYARDPAAYAGFVRQYLAPIDNRMSFNLESQALGATKEFGHPTVHAPN